MAARSKREYLAQTPEKVREVQARRASGASGKHDNRPKRQRTRATQKASALRDW